jgi:hypothetical protein
MSAGRVGYAYSHHPELGIERNQERFRAGRNYLYGTALLGGYLALRRPQIGRLLALPLGFAGVLSMLDSHDKLKQYRRMLRDATAKSPSA